MAWQNGQVNELTVHSRLGGPVRLRMHTDLKPESEFELTEVKPGSSPRNPLMQTPVIKEPIIHNPDALAPVELEPTRLMEFETEAGQRYRFGF